MSFNNLASGIVIRDRLWKIRNSEFILEISAFGFEFENFGIQDRDLGLIFEDLGLKAYHFGTLPGKRSLALLTRASRIS